MIQARRLLLTAAVVLAGIAGASPEIRAHGVGSSYAQLTLVPRRLDVAFLVAVEEIARHFPAVDGAPKGASSVPLESSIPVAAEFIRHHVVVSADGTPLVLQPLQAAPYASGTYVRFSARHPLEHAPQSLAVSAGPAFFERLGPQHVMLVEMTVEGRRQDAAVIADRPDAALTTGYRPPLAASAAFLRLGARHIFEGYDHVLFLVAVVLIGGTLGQLIAVVTAFTAAHTITLALAAFQIVSLPGRFIEGAIALSIAYVAFDNLVTAGPRHRWMLTFVFGLIHGFGLAGALAALDLPRSTLVPAVLSFNLGVEAAQIALMGVLFPVILWLAARPYRRAVVVAVSLVIFTLGVGWFVERTFF